MERRERLHGLVVAAEAELDKIKPKLHLEAKPRGRVLTRSLSPQSASHRLFETAAMWQKRLEEAKEKASYEPEHKLVFETKNYRQRSESPSSRLGVPRYEIMHARMTKAKQERERAKSVSSLELESRTSVVREMRDPSPDARCHQLYSVWTDKNQKGKELRESIERSKLPPERPKHWDEKITLEEATKIYERGMMSKMNLEMKRLAANPTKQEYNSPLLKAVTNND
jgi:hypothetical protein